MYIIFASINGTESMSNEEIKAAFDREYETLHDSVDEVQAEKDAGFLLYENGRWNQYVEMMD